MSTHLDVNKKGRKLMGHPVCDKSDFIAFVSGRDDVLHGVDLRERAVLDRRGRLRAHHRRHLLPLLHPRTRPQEAHRQEGPASR